MHKQEQKKLINSYFFTKTTKLKHSYLFITGSLLFIFHELFVSDVYAYLDPSSGTMAIQAILGVLVGAGIAVKVYWEKIKIKLSDIIMKRKN